MSTGTFQRIEPGDQRMHGPRGLLVCGYPPEEHAAAASLIAAVGGMDLPVIFASGEVGERTLKALLALPHGFGKGAPSGLRRAMILSGFTHKELHTLMAAYKNAGLPRQLWATLTPASEEWSLGELLDELAKERDRLSRGN